MMKTCRRITMKMHRSTITENASARSKCGRCLNASEKQTNAATNAHKNIKIDLNYSYSGDWRRFLAEIINLKSICSKRACVWWCPVFALLVFSSVAWLRLVMMRFVCLTYRRSWYKSVVICLKSRCYDIHTREAKRNSFISSIHDC